MAMGVDGLASGLDTTTMISQLMQVEALPQTALKNKVTVQNKAVTAYQSINTKMAALLTAAKALTTSDTWGAMKPTATSDAVAVTAKPGAAAGTLSFTVDSLAAAHTITFKDKTVNSLTAPVLSGTTVDVLLADGTTTTVTPTDNSLQSVINKINETTNAAYKATAVQVAPGKYALQLTGVATGGTTEFAKTAPTYAPAGLDAAVLGAATVTTKGTDAKLTIGDAGSGYSVTSSTNTFTDVLPGVTITATKVQTGSPVTVTLGADKDGIATKVQALVDAANAALSEIKTQTAPKTGTVAAGALAGDSAVRQLSQDILSAVATGAGALGSLSAVGIQVERGGTLSFDKQKFQDAYAANPTGTRSYFDSHTDVAHANATTGFDPGWDVANGLARKLETLGRKATEGIVLPDAGPDAVKEGLLPGLIKRRNEFIGTLNNQVAAWDIRLATRKSALQRQFSALEVALSKMQQQSSWLSGQIASLPS